MLRFKAFSSATYGDDFEAVESAVNAWLAGERLNVLEMCAAPQGQHVVLTFLYETEQAEAETLAEVTTSSVPEVFEQNLDATALDPSETDVPPLPEVELPY